MNMTNLKPTKCRSTGRDAYEQIIGRPSGDGVGVSYV